MPIVFDHEDLIEIERSWHWVKWPQDIKFKRSKCQVLIDLIGWTPINTFILFLLIELTSLNTSLFFYTVFIRFITAWCQTVSSALLSHILTHSTIANEFRWPSILLRRYGTPVDITVHKSTLYNQNIFTGLKFYKIW